MEVFESHAALQARRGYDEERCSGDLIVTDKGGPIWWLWCDCCGFTAGLPEREANPDARRVLEFRQVERFRRESGIPSALADWQLGRLQGVKPTALEAATRWATGLSKGLTLTGSAGVGKSSLAAAAANTLMERQPVRWLSVPALFARLGQKFGSDDRDKMLELLASPVALVLDDIDKASASPFAAEQLFLAVDTRVAGGAPLLVTTNLALSELAAKWPEPFGETIASRLAACESIRIEGADRRLERFAA